MPDDLINNNRRAPLPNVAALAALVDRCANRPPNMPGMGTFHGPSGYGKTEAAIYSTNRFRAVYVQVGNSWKNKKFCGAILNEMGRTPAQTIADMIEQIAEYLVIHDVPLIIDEADVLLKHGMIETAREIYELSHAAVILIGEEKLPAKLEQIERVHGRMYDWVGAQPGTLEDIALLAPIHAEGVTIHDDLRKKLDEVCHGSVRRMSVNLGRFREHALVQGVDALDLKAWGDNPFYTGEAPKARSGLR